MLGYVYSKIKIKPQDKILTRKINKILINTVEKVTQKCDYNKQINNRSVCYTKRGWLITSVS